MDLAGAIRQVKSSRYSDTYKSWYADDDEDTLKQILVVCRDKADIDISLLTRESVRKDPETGPGFASIDAQRSSITSDKPERKDPDEEIIPVRRILEKAVERSRYSPVEFRINEQDGRLALRFTGHYEDDWIEEIKSYGNYYYDKSGMEFLLPWSVMTVDSLSDYFSSRGVEVKIIKSAPSDALKSARRDLGDEIRGRNLGEKALEGLDLMRNHLDLQLLERPRKSRTLPKVFSKEEVKRILNATRNTKHKLLLWMIYSCGLRRSEITNILLPDLDRDRGVLHIREGKGRVDRIVPVSGKVWEKLDEYIDGFHPSKYLFEGQSGGRYSAESVYRVFKQALHKAGIKKDVGVHSLRHSYATHLHESGLDIRYIQELLGHKSTRTTEIYTHVSRRNLVQVRSPIEDIDVK